MGNPIGKENVMMAESSSDGDTPAIPIFEIIKNGITGNECYDYL